MRRVIAGIIIGLVTLTAYVSGRVPVSLQYTTAVQKVVPAAANCLSVTPNAVGQGNSAWVEIIASTSTAIAITSATVDTGVDGVDFTVAIGTGAALSETEIAASPWGRQQLESVTRNNTITFYNPVQIPVSTRVTFRMRKGGTSTTAWCFAFTYIELPAGSNVTTTTNIQNAVFPGTITPSGSSWGNSSWLQISASTANDEIWTGFNFLFPCLQVQYEVDLGVGPAASEVVVHTARGYFFDNGGSICANTGGLNTLYFYPGIKIPAGSRTAWRLRKGNTSVTQWFSRGSNITSYTGLDNLSTSGIQKIAPPAANGPNVTSNGGIWGTTGTYVEYIASASADLALTTIVSNEKVSSYTDYDIAVGGGGSEVVVGTIRKASTADSGGGNATIPIRPAINITSGSRVALRLVTENASQTESIALGYIENPDFANRTSLVLKVAPNHSSTTVTPDSTEWNNSAWSQVEASSTTGRLVTAIIPYMVNSAPRQFEVDLGIGDSGSEVVKGTVRGFYGGNGGNATLNFVVPFYIPPNVRTAFRFRGTGTNVLTWSMAYQYLDNFIPGGVLPYIIGGKPTYRAY